MKPADLEILHKLNQQFQGTVDRVGFAGSADRKVAVLDFPNHQNVGDSMIWAGEVKHLDALGAEIEYVADIWRYDRQTLEARSPESTILLHGGGNFGDVWPEFQDFREAVINSLKDRRVVQLPQTVWFNSAETAARTNDILSRHPDFTLLVRDYKSLARCRDLLPDVRCEFCPDGALGVGPLQRSSQSRDRVLLLRGDREVLPDRDEALAGLAGNRMDWGLSGTSGLLWRASALPAKAHRARSLRNLSYPLVAGTYHRAASLNMRAGLRAFRKAEAVLTDRLHAHVLAVLLDVPHVVMDNSYGKVSSIVNDYSGQFSTVELSSSPRDARQRWDRLVGAANRLH